nr:uncharacterized mitochondrial protein AtMg00810-like [Tanacetum cinerariifolium]
MEMEKVMRWCGDGKGDEVVWPAVDEDEEEGSGGYGGENESIEVDEVVNIKESKNHPLEQVIDPKDFNEALGDKSCVIAMQEELNRFVANDIWDLVPLPMSQPIIGTKWVFRNKLDENGRVSRNKARFASQGYNQQEEIKLTKDDEADSMDSTKYRDAVKRIFRYIRGTSHLGLWYPKETRIETIVYADSDHAGDYGDRKSTTGICTFIGCRLTSWLTKKQTSLAISMTEAEYVSAKKACQKALWMKQALIDYEIRLEDVLIMCHNKDYKSIKVYLPRIHRSRKIDKDLRDSYRTLEKRLFHEGRFVTPSFIEANNMLPSFQVVGEITPQLIQIDYKSIKVYLPRIHRSRKIDKDLRDSYRTLEKRLFHEGRFVTPSFIEANNMLPSFQVVGLELCLTLDEPICP